MEPVVIYEKKEELAYITINRPEVYNALNTQAKQGILESFRRASHDDEVKCIILTGAGRNAFSAGQDFNESHDIKPNNTKDWLDSFQPLYDEIRYCQKPTLCVVNGACAGSGFQLPLLCDIRLATPNARFGLTEVDAGYPTITGSSLLWDHLGQSLTIEMSLTGRLLSAQEALQHGLITKIIEWEDLDEEVTAYAKMLAQKPPTAIRTMKKWFRLIEEERYYRSFEYAEEAHYHGYASGEPKIWQEKFMAEHKARKEKKLSETEQNL
ncbi:MAG: enoyl-CoA hydratase/isomerase family protein [Lachnospiraceae bacterium]|nr:enoyl-CoA hydratase/isomerase family protein [Lachnospiraceae bacterium]